MLTKELLVNYQSRRQDDLDLCTKSFATGNFEEIERVGHKLKGNGSMFGFPELSTLGEKMEQAALNRDKNAMENTIRELAAWIADKKKGL